VQASFCSEPAPWLYAYYWLLTTAGRCRPPSAPRPLAGCTPSPTTSLPSSDGCSTQTSASWRSHAAGRQRTRATTTRQPGRATRRRARRRRACPGPSRSTIRRARPSRSGRASAASLPSARCERLCAGRRPTPQAEATCQHHARLVPQYQCCDQKSYEPSWGVDPWVHPPTRTPHPTHLTRNRLGG
jgi:hypothetical protein